MNLSTTNLFFFSFFLVFSVLIGTSLCDVNPNFLACEPQTCGNGQNISYPFYIEGKQDLSCGFPDFALVCASNGSPMLNLSGTLYIVDEIFHDNHSLRLSNPNFPIPNNSPNCLSPSQNLTIGYRFRFAPNQKEVVLFFDCESPPDEMKENVWGCYEGNRTRWVLGMAVDDGEYAKKMKYARDNCRGEAMTTMVENMKGGIREALGRGFLLKPRNWTVTACDKCQISGGRCGFLDAVDAYGFRCFCPDRIHVGGCHPGLSLSLPLSSFTECLLLPFSPYNICSVCVLPLD